MSEPTKPTSRAKPAGEARSGGAIPGILKGLATTARTLAKPSHTAEYPDVQPDLPPAQPRGDRAARGELHLLHALRPRVPGLVHLHRLAQGDDPRDDTGGRDRQRNVLDRFAIDFSLCMYCGICIEVCPFDALHWSPEFEYAELDIRDLLHEKDRLGEWMPTVPPPPALDEHSAEPAEIAAANKPARPVRTPAARPARVRPGTAAPGAANPEAATTELPAPEADA